MCMKILNIKYTRLKQVRYLGERCDVIGWLVGFYGILTLIGYLMANPVLYK